MSVFRCIACEAPNVTAVRCHACGGRRFALDRRLVARGAACFSQEHLAPIVSLDVVRSLRGGAPPDEPGVGSA